MYEFALYSNRITEGSINRDDGRDQFNNNSQKKNSFSRVQGGLSPRARSLQRERRVPVSARLARRALRPVHALSRLQARLLQRLELAVHLRHELGRHTLRPGSQLLRHPRAVPERRHVREYRARSVPVHLPGGLFRSHLREGRQSVRIQSVPERRDLPRARRDRSVRVCPGLRRVVLRDRHRRVCLAAVPERRYLRRRQEQLRLQLPARLAGHALPVRRGRVHAQGVALQELPHLHQPGRRLQVGTAFFILSSIVIMNSWNFQ